MAALLISFAASGLLHEAVITLPAGGGTGGPFLYFMLQGIGLCLERRFLRRLPRALQKAWTVMWLALPLPLLFPPAFVLNIMSPFVRALTSNPMLP